MCLFTKDRILLFNKKKIKIKNTLTFAPKAKRATANSLNMVDLYNVLMKCTLAIM